MEHKEVKLQWTCAAPTMSLQRAIQLSNSKLLRSGNNNPQALIASVLFYLGNPMWNGMSINGQGTKRGRNGYKRLWASTISQFNSSDNKSMDQARDLGILLHRWYIRGRWLEEIEGKYNDTPNWRKTIKSKQQIATCVGLWHWSNSSMEGHRFATHYGKYYLQYLSYRSNRSIGNDHLVGNNIKSNKFLIMCGCERN